MTNGHAYSSKHFFWKKTIINNNIAHNITSALRCVFVWSSACIYIVSFQYPKNFTLPRPAVFQLFLSIWVGHVMLKKTSAAANKLKREYKMLCYNYSFFATVLTLFTIPVNESTHTHTYTFGSYSSSSPSLTSLVRKVCSFLIPR